jgi:predicted Zn-dependent peptidase
LWPGHPLSRSPIGSRDSILQISGHDLRAHHARFFTPRNTVVAVAGKINRDEVLAAVEKTFGDWDGGQADSPSPLPFTAASSAPRVAWVRNPDSQVEVQVAFRTPGLDSRGFPTLKILRRLLTGGMASLLMQRLREQEGLVYGVEGNLTLFAESGCFAIDLAVAPDKLLKTLRELLDVLGHICRDPISGEEFSRLVKGFLFDLEFSCDQTEELAARYGWGESTGCLRTMEDERAEVLAQSPRTLLETAAAVFCRENLKAAVVGPFRRNDQAAFEKLLEDFR